MLFKRPFFARQSASLSQEKKAPTPFVYFRKLHSEIDISRICAELSSNNLGWSLDESRKRVVSVQRETDSIFLRQGIAEAGIDFNDAQNCEDAPASAAFPEAMNFLRAYADELNGQLSRALFARLKPGGRVHGHVDHGSYYARRDRYHLALISDWERNTLTIGDETVHMKPGELWWFDNKVWHESENNSNSWRVHLIFDVLPNRME